MNRKQERKLETQKLREEGAEAFRQGRSIQSCPHGLMDLNHWVTGFQEARHATQQDREPIPDAEVCPDCAERTQGLDGEPKWCCYCGARLSGIPAFRDET